MRWENFLYRAEMVWRQLERDISAPVVVGIVGVVVILWVMIADLRERNRLLRVMRTQWHCIDPPNSFDQEG